MGDDIVIQVAADLIKYTGEDLGREGLKDTPHRFLSSWKHWTNGYGIEPADVLRTFSDGAEEYDELVFQGNIPTFSLCEHHLAPFFGLTHIAYIPQGKIVGLSKLIRLVDVFARRLQVQERLTNQIADSVDKHLSPLGVGVVLQCRHHCMESRGVQKMGTVTVTSAMRGAIKDEPSARGEFLQFVQSASSGKTI